MCSRYVKTAGACPETQQKEQPRIANVKPPPCDKDYADGSRNNPEYLRSTMPGHNDTSLKETSPGFSIRPGHVKPRGTLGAPFPQATLTSSVSTASEKALWLAVRRSRALAMGLTRAAGCKLIHSGKLEKTDGHFGPCPFLLRLCPLSGLQRRSGHRGVAWARGQGLSVWPPSPASFANDGWERPSLVSTCPLFLLKVSVRLILVRPQTDL